MPTARLTMTLLLPFAFMGDALAHDHGQTPLEIAQSGYEAVRVGDLDAMAAAMSPEIVWHEAESLPYGGTFHGPDAVMQNIFARLGADFEVFAAVPERFLDGGNTVTVIGRYSGTHRVTGRSFTAAFGHVFRFEDGKLAEFWQFTDTAAWLAVFD